MPDDDLRIFPDDFVPNVQASDAYKRWARSSPADRARWEAFRDALLANPATAVAPAMSTRFGKALAAAGREHMTISALVGQVTNPYPPAPPQPPSDGGTLLWTGDFDTGDESQWDYIHRYTADRFRVTTAADGVVPREGSHFARVECRYNEPASWTAARNVSMAQKDGVPTIGLGADSYSGFSVYLPSDYQPTYVGGDNYGNNFFEWHADASQTQAPTHFGVNGLTNQYFVDLHTHPTAWSPVLLQDIGPIIKGRWVDFVLRVLWRNDSQGVYEFWVDGTKVVSWTGRTWGNASFAGPQIVYPEFGLYRSNATHTNVIYIDALKIGTSYGAVQP